MIWNIRQVCWLYVNDLKKYNHYKVVKYVRILEDGCLGTYAASANIHETSKSINVGVI